MMRIAMCMCFVGCFFCVSHFIFRLPLFFAYRFFRFVFWLHLVGAQSQAPPRISNRPSFIRVTDLFFCSHFLFHFCFGFFFISRWFVLCYHSFFFYLSFSSHWNLRMSVQLYVPFWLSYISRRATCSLLSKKSLRVCLHKINISNFYAYS